MVHHNKNRLKIFLGKWSYSSLTHFGFWRETDVLNGFRGKVPTLYRQGRGQEWQLALAMPQFVSPCLFLGWLSTKSVRVPQISLLSLFLIYTNKFSNKSGRHEHYLNRGQKEASSKNTQAKYWPSLLLKVLFRRKVSMLRQMRRSKANGQEAQKWWWKTEHKPGIWEWFRNRF